MDCAHASRKVSLIFFNSIDADFFVYRSPSYRQDRLTLTCLAITSTGITPRKKAIPAQPYDLPDFPSASYSQKLIFLCTSYTAPIIQSTRDLLLLHRQIPLLRKNHIYSTLVRFVSPDKFHSEPSPQI